MDCKRLTRCGKVLTSDRNVKKEKKEKDGLFALLSPSIPFATALK